MLTNPPPLRSNWGGQGGSRDRPARAGYDRSIATGMYLLDMVYVVVTGRRPESARDVIRTTIAAQ
jgi:hypothetical protein